MRRDEAYHRQADNNETYFFTLLKRIYFHRVIVLTFSTFKARALKFWTQQPSMNTKIK